MFLESVEQKARRKSGGKKGEATLAVNLLLATGIIAMLVMGGMLVYRHKAFLEMKRVVEAQTFYAGTTIENIDVSGMTLNDAMQYWRAKVEPAYAERRVEIEGEGALTPMDLGYTSDYEEVLSNAWSAGRSGSLETRYRGAMSRRSHPSSHEVSRTLYVESAVDDYVQALAQRVDRPAKDATIESFDLESYAFVFTDDETGSRLDADGLKRDIVAAIEAGGGSVDVVVETIEPQITRETAESQYGMIAYAVTNASSSSANRLSNIRTAVSIINGTCLHPGETFSFNDTVGERTTARGFKVATAYSSGTVTEEVGGGICQVSTTLFNAAVKSDLQIVERHNHSLTVAYVDRGKDAAVNWRSQDLRFTNTTGDDIYICCFVSSDKRVRFGIFGRLIPNGETITVEGVTTKTIKYDTVYQPSMSLAPGQTRVIEQGKNGYEAEAYKIRWDADGNEIRRELLCKSAYKARNEVVEYGM